VIRFVEVLPSPDLRPTPYALGEVWINKQHVVNLREASAYKQFLHEGKLPSDLESHHEFTAITVNNGTVTETHVVVGSVPFVASRFNHGKKTLLKG
jgi:hypothetical protein